MTKRTNPHWAANLASGLQQNMPSITKNAMQTHVEAEAKRLVYLGHPDHLEKKTGNLRNSIHTGISGTNADISASVGTNVVYGPVHEFGAVITDQNGVTRFIPPRPFLIPAFEAKKEDVASDVINEFRRITKEMSLK